MLNINLLAPIRLMRAVVPTMVAQARGAIVNIGSLAGEIGIQGTYSATKFGLRGLTDSVRRELAGSGVGVTLIEPSYIATPLTPRGSWTYWGSWRSDICSARACSSGLVFATRGRSV